MKKVLKKLIDILGYELKKRLLIKAALIMKPMRSKRLKWFAKIR